MASLIAGPIAEWMAAVMDLRLIWSGVKWVGVVGLVPRLRVTFGLSLMVACGAAVAFFGWGVGDGSALALPDVIVATDLPLGVAEGDSAEFRVGGAQMVFGVEPEMVRFFPVVGVEQRLSMARWELCLKPMRAAESKKYLTFLLRTAMSISACCSAARLSI